MTNTAPETGQYDAFSPTNHMGVGMPTGSPVIVLSAAESTTRAQAALAAQLYECIGQAAPRLVPTRNTCKACSRRFVLPPGQHERFCSKRCRLGTLSHSIFWSQQSI